MITFLLSLLRKFNSEEEAKLIEKVANNDESALSNLYDIYSRIVYSFIIKIVKDKQEAEDLLQSVFIQIWEKASSFDKTKGTVYSWVVTMSKNRAIDKIRSKAYKKSRQNVNDIEKVTLIDYKNPSSLDASIAAERSEFLRKAMEQIPEDQKLVLNLAYFEGFTQSEISEQYNIPLGTVKTRMRQALIKLEKLLKPILA
ncbi:MAG: sigma-70 family RNA polymerase sigma factor [Ignavibacteriaceae bacterium]